VNKKRNNQIREAHIGHEWDSTKESSDEDVKVATVAVHKSSSSPRIFTNLFDDDDHHSPHTCLMAKGEKVNQKLNLPNLLVTSLVVNLVKALVMMTLVMMMNLFK
jgi:hypothetical protein